MDPYNGLILGCGPAGLCLAEQVPMHGVHVSCSPLSVLPNSNGVWVDEFEAAGLEKKDVCASNGVKFHKANAWKVEHKELSSTISCSDDSEQKASMFVNTTGFSSPFTEYDKRRSHGYQIAHGILATGAGPPVRRRQDGARLLMDCRDSDMSHEP